MSLTMPNKKYFFDFLLLKIFTGHNIENSSEMPHIVNNMYKTTETGCVAM